MIAPAPSAFAARICETVVRYFLAMAYTVSPRTTVCTLAEDAAVDEVAAGADAVAFALRRSFCPG